MELKILKGDNLELLKQYPDNYFDSVVTDCPYGLGKEPNAIKLLQDWIDHGYHEIKGKGFMGKSWDAFVPQPLFWKEVYRVLKPGGYVLAFFGTRTYDWGTLAIRLAGFEIRDMICWHYGSGFPKSLDISKQLDKMAGAEREIISEVPAFGIGGKGKYNGHSEGATHKVSKSSTNEAKQWYGWGTALKPATEPICVARKPLDGNVAENILKWGTGGINLDGCKIGNDEIISCEKTKGESFTSVGNGAGYNGKPETVNIGRFPANVIFDPFMANELDKQTGILTSGSSMSSYIQKESENKSMSGKNYERPMIYRVGDSGGASRFFMVAKDDFFTYIREEINLLCGNISENQQVDGLLSGALQAAEKYFHAVDQFITGSRKTGKYLKDLKSIISILIRQMMQLKTLNCLLSLNIESCMVNLGALINLSMELNLENAKNVKFIEVLMISKLELQELIKDIVLIVKKSLYKIGENQTENITTNTTENIEKIFDRFMYCAKASQFERNAGCDDLDAIKTNDGHGSREGVDNAYQRDENYRKNHHPTVKPISLMSYLQRLVTPPGGKTLDPFAGSGTSGCSAYFENIGECVLMELDENGTYLPIIEARTKYWSIEYNRRKYMEDLKEPEKQPENQMKLF